MLDKRFHVIHLSRCCNRRLFAPRGVNVEKEKNTIVILEYHGFAPEMLLPTKFSPAALEGHVDLLQHAQLLWGYVRCAEVLVVYLGVF